MRVTCVEIVLVDKCNSWAIRALSAPLRMSSATSVSRTDNTAQLWTMDEPDAESVALPHPAAVASADFSPDGRWLATACGDANTYLWDLEAIGQKTRLSGAAGEVRDVEFSADGRHLVAVSYDGTLRVWPVDPRQGSEPIVLDAGEPLHTVEFADEGRRVVAGGSGDAVMLWYLGDDLGVDALRTRLGAATEYCLSPEQRTALIGQSPEAATEATQACVAARRSR